ncbi:hypothetical protein FMUND_6743 [Fusarium mundagurra]|uniref:CCHC-type domain-containing protein n=1 Tax=Fusarium mundagurra TaxID=1567541 RepID=A0A8H5YQN0_9HYPO|nr:hypothetical protein FMUND_6743 [Fusarium mundagurra]
MHRVIILASSSAPQRRRPCALRKRKVLPSAPTFFADSFHDSWSRELSSAGPASKSTYSSVTAASPPTACDPPHRQGQPTTIALPGEDLRAFIRLEAGAPARAQSSYAIRTLIREKLGNVSNKIRQIFQEKQAEWAAELEATTVETNKEWFTYVISDFPRRLTDFYGNEVDSDSIISDEIEIQTGLNRPRDTGPSGGRAARLIDKTDRRGQCETCWDYHSVRHCHRQPVCQRCGKTGYTMDDCTAPEQCINCLGLHAAGFHAAELQRDNTALYEQQSARAPSLAASGAPSYIMVATTPLAGDDAEEEPEHPRPGSLRKRRIVLITCPQDQE